MQVAMSRTKCQMSSRFEKKKNILEMNSLLFHRMTMSHDGLRSDCRYLFLNYSNDATFKFHDTILETGEKARISNLT